MNGYNIDVLIGLSCGKRKRLFLFENDFPKNFGNFTVTVTSDLFGIFFLILEMCEIIESLNNFTNISCIKKKLNVDF